MATDTPGRYRVELVRPVAASGDGGAGNLERALNAGAEQGLTLVQIVPGGDPGALLLVWSLPPPRPEGKRPARVHARLGYDVRDTV